MPPGEMFEDEPQGTREAIMHATYRALRDHGYAGLTIQKIGDEFPKSKSLLYHHYDGKDELLVDFLESMLDRMETDLPVEPTGDAYEQLVDIIDHVIPPTEDEERRSFTAALIELRGQAAHNPAFRDHFTRSDRFFHDRLADVIRSGVEEGTFLDVDVESVASLLLTTITGAMLVASTTDSGTELDDVKRELTQYLDRRLLAEAR